MKKKILREMLDRVETWPKEKQDVTYDLLASIDAYDSLLAEDILRSREDIKNNLLTSQDDLIKGFHLFGN